MDVRRNPEQHARLFNINPPLGGDVMRLMRHVEISPFSDEARTVLAGLLKDLAADLESAP